MNKRVFKTILAVVLVLSMMTTAFAAWRPSEVQQGVTGSDAAITDKNGNETKVEIISEPKKEQDGKTQKVDEAEDAYIKITPVGDTMKANQDHDAQGNNANKSFLQKANDGTDSGLTYSTNEDTNLVYRSAQKADTTTKFLNSVNDKLQQDVENAIQTKVEAKKEELNGKAAALEDEVKQLEAEGKTEEAAAKQQELDQVNKEIDKVNDPNYASVDNYAPIALFDVSLSAGAREQLGDGTLTVEVNVDGVHEDSDVLGIHFFGELDDYDAVKDGLETDYDNTIMQYEHEILDAEPSGEGKVRFSMTHFSPVMILIRVEDEETLAAPAEPEMAETPAEEKPAEPGTEAEVAETAEAEQGTSYTWIIVLVVVIVVVAVGAGVFVSQKNKKKTEAKK